VEHKKYGNIKARQVVITVQGLKMVDGKEFDSGVNVEP
jgi:hypothetical protein